MLLLREWLDAGATFNPISPKLRTDPYTVYRRLREKDPVHRSRLFNGWVLSKHAHVDSVLRDQHHFANDVRNAADSVSQDGQDEVHSMLYLDQPDHTRLRSLVSQAFTRGATQVLQPRIEGIVDELLDRVDTGQPFDAIESLAYPLPVIVISELLGVPTEDREQFKAWSTEVAKVLEPRETRQDWQSIDRARNELMAYFEPIIEARYEEPRDDLISALAMAEEEGDKLTHQEVLVTLMLLLVAGNETTTNLIGNGLLALLQHRGQLGRLRQDPSLIPSAIEELLRFDSPVQIDSRTALADQVIDGKHIKRGQQVLLLIGAANRDPDAFPDPNVLDLTRDARSHISFGRGIHHCLGSHLAIMEGRVAFAKLLERFPRMRLAGKPRFSDRVVLRGLQSLPVKAGSE
ncbi:MAG: hypothetical protein BZY88_00805 [SAR202 cluster bacterium Io17-Chloro-G9]|nr:MAG: hypothetical protein BZY88_00805 [SAR202 cluster bacterium Io17-Chloro-G9]